MTPLILTPEAGGERLDAFLARSGEGLTRSAAQRLLEEGAVTSGGRPLKKSEKTAPGQVIEVVLPEPEPVDVLPQNIPLDVVYEDRDVILVNKPKGMVVHPAAGHYTGTLVNALMYHCREDLSGINGVLRPGIVHRIDMDTTGVLIACKNDQAHNSIAAQLKEHSITRRYQAIVHGVVKEDEGVVDAPIGRHPQDRKKMCINHQNGKSAVTHYRVLKRFSGFTHIECRLETGRTHQIRVHMASLGHPLLGDQVYGPARCPYKLQGQTLHAGILGFIHPTTGAYMEFTAPLPEYFKHLLEVLPGA